MTQDTIPAPLYRRVRPRIFGLAATLTTSGVAVAAEAPAIAVAALAIHVVTTVAGAAAARLGQAAGRASALRLIDEAGR